MLLEEMTEFQNPSVMYQDNQGAILLAKNRQAVMCTNHIDIRRHFMRNIVEDKDINIKYIGIKEDPVYIMTNNCSEADLAKHTKRIT